MSVLFVVVAEAEPAAHRGESAFEESVRRYNRSAPALLPQRPLLLRRSRHVRAGFSSGRSAHRLMRSRCRHEAEGERGVRAVASASDNARSKDGAAALLSPQRPRPGLGTCIGGAAVGKEG